MQSEPRYLWLDGAVADGGHVVTANRRVARELRRTYDHAQVIAGKKSWLTPAIRSWQGWLVSLYDSAEADERQSGRLSNHASLLLWEQCLNDVMPARIHNFPGFVRQSSETWNRICDWSIPLATVSEYAGYGDNRLFATAAQAYQQRLASEGWIDPAGLPAVVAERIADGSISVPPQLSLVGFDRLTPIVEQLLAALKQKGCHVDVLLAGSAVGKISVRSFVDDQAELRAAGAWARNELSQRPDSRIAIVCSQLERNSGRAARLAREGYAPGWQYGGNEYRFSVNVSYGQRLAEYPAIAVALAYLRWTCGGLSSREISVLLRSRLAGSTEIAGRCRLELGLRRLADRSWTPAGLASALAVYDQSSDAVEWIKSIRDIAAFRRDQGGSASPVAWAERFHELLQKLSWPGRQNLDSGEFQLINRWRSLLNEFSATECIAPRMRLADAVRRVSSMASDVVFQPERSGGSVQVLGVLEAAGLELDGIWITGLDSSRWPPAAAPLPLISRQLQRDHAMPDSSPNDTLDFSRRVLKRLATSAKRVFGSWARADQDSDQSASQLLSEFTVVDTDNAADPGWHAASFAAAGNTENVAPNKGPPVGNDEKVQGGAYTVQQQHTEPFSAFATGRLGIRDIVPFETGIPARTRGTIVHRALQKIYEDHPDSRVLQGWDESKIVALTEDVSMAVVETFIQQADATHRRLFEIERERLQRLLVDFVAAEKERPPFRVDSLERDLSFKHCEVILDLQVDRVDQLDDGSWLIADYKTGAAKNLLNRQGELSDLQLAVYSCAWPGNIGGVVLINVDSRAILYKGAGASTHWHKANNSDWPQRLADWQQQVLTAMQGIANGDVRVNMNLASDQTRALALLSRIEELRRDR